MKPIRIGTRDSELALWQARNIQNGLEQLGFATQLHPVKSQGDLDLTQPLYEMGITGIFTRTLDVALVNGSIDIAVHSLKDVPTRLPHGMVQAAVPPRADFHDILVYKAGFNPDDALTIATGSLRRRAQWLQMYPHHQVEDLRGNVNTRLKKLVNNKDWSAAIFAKAGLARIALLQKLPSMGLSYLTLDSFVPAPAQGAMMVAAMQSNTAVVQAVQKLNDRPSAVCVDLERKFLQILEGGCTAPIGALAVRDTMGHISFHGCLTSLDGREHFSTQGKLLFNDDTTDDEVYAFAKAQSQKILENGGADLLQQIKSELKA